MAPHAWSRGEELGREHRLRRRLDFMRCYRHGRKRHGTLATLHFHPNGQRQARLGITASRKVGNSVVRHRLKRRVREIFRRWPLRSSLRSLDVVVHLRPGAGKASFDELRRELEALLSRIPARRREDARR